MKTRTILVTTQDIGLNGFPTAKAVTERLPGPYAIRLKKPTELKSGTNVPVRFEMVERNPKAIKLKDGWEHRQS